MRALIVCLAVVGCNVDSTIRTVDAVGFDAAPMDMATAVDMVQPDAATVDLARSVNAPPGSPCSRQFDCTNPQCAAPLRAPDGYTPWLGCCVESASCPAAVDAGPVCAFTYRITLPNGDEQICLDCGAGVGVRCFPF